MWQRYSPRWGSKLRQCSGNIARILWQCCYPMLGLNIETMFGQCCVNVVQCCSLMLGTHIGTRFRQCCMNVLPTLVSKVVLACLGSRMTVTFKFSLFCNITKHFYIGTFTSSNIMSDTTYHSSCVDRQRRYFSGNALSRSTQLSLNVNSPYLNHILTMFSNATFLFSKSLDHVF